MADPDLRQSLLSRPREAEVLHTRDQKLWRYRNQQFKMSSQRYLDPNLDLGRLDHLVQETEDALMRDLEAETLDLDLPPNHQHNNQVQVHQNPRGPPHRHNLLEELPNPANPLLGWGLKMAVMEPDQNPDTVVQRMGVMVPIMVKPDVINPLEGGETSAAMNRKERRIKRRESPARSREKQQADDGNAQLGDESVKLQDENADSEEERKDILRSFKFAGW